MFFRVVRTLIIGVVLSLMGLTHSFSATISGTVSTLDHQPLAGALITVTSSDGLYTETVYSQADGLFLLESVQDGLVQVRARKINHADTIKPVDLASTEIPKLEFNLRRLSSPQEISDNLTASAHFTRVKFDNRTDYEQFKVDCLTCHQLGNPHTRKPRPDLYWSSIVTRMLGFHQVANDEISAEYVDVLKTAFDGDTLSIEQKQPVDPTIFTSHIVQWKLPNALMAHDVEYHAGEDKFYTVDQARDKIYITDPTTNETETFDIPDGNIPVGGKFLQLFKESNPLGLTVSRGPHSLQEGPDGKFYTTDSISGQIGVFDPETHSFTGHDVGGMAMYPHTIRFDTKGMAWFTIAVSNQLGRFNPLTGQMTRIDLPQTTDRPEFPIHMPYGIDVHPQDGTIWYNRMMANRIGWVDPETLEVKEIVPPFVGPRRMRFAKDGTLWIPSFGSGSLFKLNTETMEFKEYPLPTLSSEETEAPYALGVHPDTQEVWITANMSDRMFRFLPKQGSFVAYPLPTKGVYLRDIIFTPDGRVCAASSVVLPALMLEGGMQEIVCLEPDRYKDT